ncbi:MAG TPA: hypothetical protein VGA59_03315 [Ramlibacter sp.]
MPKLFRSSIVLAVVLFAGALQAQESDPKHLAPGFHARPAGSKLVIVPADMELFSISAGGVLEPKADWTEAAQRNFKAALAVRRDQLGANAVELQDAELDEFSELNALQRAVAEAVFVHHTGMGMKLPTKNERLDWSLGEAVKPLKARTGADYALFTWIRDSYASDERKATMIAMALLGAISFGGEQIGYASLVDLNSGRVVWFNDLRRMSGDMRDEKAAMETVETLLEGFPVLQ